MPIFAVLPPSQPNPDRPMRRPPLFYGWRVAGACSAIAFVTWGVNVYSLGVFLNAYQRHYQWPLTALATGITLFYFGSGIAGLLAGRAIDRVGPRRVLGVGGGLTGIAMLLLGHAREARDVQIGCVVLAAGFGCTHTFVLGSVIGRWFTRRRALAMTVGLFGATVGGMVLAPLSIAIIEQAGIAAGGATLAAVAWLMIGAAVVFVIRDSPRELGLWPDGDPAPPPNARPTATVAAWSVGRAMRSAAWLTLTLAFMVGIAGQAAFLMYQVTFTSRAIGVEGAAVAVAIMTGGAVAGRFVFGGLGDRLSKRFFAIVCFSIQAGSVLVSGRTDQAGWLFGAAFLFGLTVGNTIALQPLLMTEAFGVAIYGRLNGVSYLLIQWSGAAMQTVVGSLAEATGGFAMPLTFTAALAALAALLLWLPVGRGAVVEPAMPPQPKGVPT